MSVSLHDHTRNTSRYCRLLLLPAEIRDIIIAYSVQNDLVTISAVAAAGKSSGPESRWIPVVSSGYDTELLADTLHQQNKTRTKSLRQDHPTTLDALAATCKSLRSDVQLYMGARPVETDAWTRGAPFDLYLTFPYGVCALMERFPNLLTRVRNIKIVSVYEFNEPAKCSCFKAAPNAHKGAGPSTRMELQSYQLARLVTFLTGRNAAAAQMVQRESELQMEDSLKRQEAIRARPRRILQRNREPPMGVMTEYETLEAGIPPLTEPLPFEHFQFRILYPNRGSHYDGYTTMWSGNTPSSLVLHYMFGAYIWLSTARGEEGTSVEIEAVPNQDGRRMLTSLWPKKYTKGPEGILAAGWMDRDWEDKEWKSFARPTFDST